MFVLQPRFGGTIIDIVSGDLETPQQKSEAVSAVNRTILGIFLIVIIGYEHVKTFSKLSQFYCQPILTHFLFFLQFNLHSTSSMVIFFCK